MTDGAPRDPLEDPPGPGPEGEPPPTDADGTLPDEAAVIAAAFAASAPTEDPATPSDPGDASLLALIDRLASLLDRSELTELEVQAGATGLVLRKPVAPAPVAVPAATAASPAAGGGAGTTSPDASGQTAPSGPSRPSVKAPLTGIWYAAPSIGTAPYVTVGGEVAAGQVIGLIEAMKLFNEIKSDLSGRVVKIQAENGKLVKARQPLIEVDPL